jgi:hypothetical protein
MISSMALGWWGIPFGLIITPIILAMNGVALIYNPLKKSPSKALRAYARLVAAHELLKKQRANGPQSELVQFFGRAN